MKILTGTYSGDVTNNRAFTGLGFQPDMVLIKAKDSPANAVFKTSLMSSNNALNTRDDAGFITDAILSLDADGFTIGVNAKTNENLRSFIWVAIKDDSSGDFKVFSYTGNGTSQSINIGWQPAFVMVKGNQSTTGAYRFEAQTGDATSVFYGAGNQTNNITSISSTGFALGGDTKVNSNAIAFHGFAFKTGLSYVKALSYTGNATDNRDYTTPDLGTIWSWIKGNTVDNPRWRTGGNIGDEAQAFDASSAANMIKKNTAKGVQFGSDTAVNGVSSNTYYGLFVGDQQANPVGSGSNVPAKAASFSSTITIDEAIPAGALVVVGFVSDAKGTNSAIATNYTAQDGGARTYTRQAFACSANVVASVIFTYYNDTGLSIAAGSVVTVSHPEQTGKSLGYVIFPNVPSTNQIDVSGGDAATIPSTKNHLATALTTTNNDDVIVGVVSSDNAGSDLYGNLKDSVLIANGGTTGGSGGSNATILMAYRRVYKTGTYQVGGYNISSNPQYISCAIAVKITPAATPTAYTQTITDAATLTDSIANVKSFTKTLSDTNTLTDTLANVRTLGRTYSETVTLAEDGRYNLIYNPSFEVDLANTDLELIGVSATVARDTTAGQQGTASAKVDITANAATEEWRVKLRMNITNPYTFKANTTYTLSAWIKSSDSRGVKLAVEDSGSTVNYYNTQFITSTSWQRRSFTFTVGATGGPASCRLMCNTGNAGQVWIDGILLEENVAVEQDYFDGSTARGRWTGTAHNSPSAYSSFTKQQNKLQSEVLSLIKAFDKLFTAGGGSFSQLLSETLTLTDTLIRQSNKTVLETLTVTDTLIKQAAKNLAETVTHTDTLIRRTVRLLQETVTQTDTLTKIQGKMYQESITLADTFSKQTTKTLLETLTNIDTLNRQTVRLFQETITLADSVAKNIVTGKLLEETIILTDTLTRQTSRFFQETITHTDSVLKGLPTKALQEVATLTDSIANVKIALRTYSESLIIGDRGLALSFDGVDDRVNINNHANLNEATTITVIVKTKTTTNTAPSSYFSPVHKGTFQASGWQMFFLNNNASSMKLRVRLNRSDAVTPFNDSVDAALADAFNATVPHEFAWTYNAGLSKLFIDGKKVGEKTHAAPYTSILPGTQQLVYGHEGNRWLPGLIGLGKQYNRELSETEILDHAKGLTVANTNLVMHHTFDGTLVDQSGSNLVVSTSGGPVYDNSPFRGLDLLISKPALEALAVTDTLIKQGVKAFLESLSLTDTLSRVKGAIATFNETISLADSMTRQISRALNETITATDTLIKQTARTYNETLTLTDTVTKSPLKSFNEILALTATLAKSSGKIFIETTTITDTLTKQLTRLFLETITHTATVTALKGNQILLETITLTQTTTLQTGKSFVEALSLVATYTTTMARTLNETITLADTFTRTSSRLFQETLTFIDTVVARAGDKILSETLIFSDKVKTMRNSVNGKWGKANKTSQSTWTRAAKTVASTWAKVKKQKAI